MKTFHLIKYNLKVFGQNMELIFWMFFFPVFMMTIFGITMGNLDYQIDLKEKKIFLYVENSIQIPKNPSQKGGNSMEDDIYKNLSSYNDEVYKSYAKILGEIFTLSEISSSNSDEMQKAIEELEEGKALSIVKMSLSPRPELSMKVVGSGTSEQILKMILDEFNQKSLFAQAVIEKKMSAFYEDLEIKIKALQQEGKSMSDEQIEAKVFKEIEQIFKDEEFSKLLSGENALPKLKVLSISGKSQNPFNTIVYALLGYSIFTSIFMGFHISQVNRVDKTGVGHRIGASGILNSQIITSNLVVSMIISVIPNILLPIYGNFYFTFFEISYLPYYGILLLVSIFSSVCIGMNFNFILPFSENVQNGIMTFILLFFGFASGMMSPQMKTIMDKVPILNKINPVALISDSIYAIFEYNDAGRFFSNIYILAIMGAAAFGLLLIFNRRKDYDSL